jgi:hypothetical protein
MTTYAYVLADFPNNACAPDALLAQIRAATAITVVCDAVNTSGGDVSVVFRTALSGGEKTALDGVVGAHDGVPLPSGGNVDNKGNPVYAPTFLAASEQARLEGYELIGDPGATTIFDIEVEHQMLVQGGQFWIVGAVAGDTCHFSVVDKNDVLGLHTQLGLPLGTPIELVRYVKNYRLPPTPLYQDSIIMPTVAPVAPGLFLRAQLECVAGGGQRRVGLLYRWYIGG